MRWGNKEEFQQEGENGSRKPSPLSGAPFFPFMHCAPNGDSRVEGSLATVLTLLTQSGQKDRKTGDRQLCGIWNLLTGSLKAKSGLPLGFVGPGRALKTLNKCLN